MLLPTAAHCVGEVHSYQSRVCPSPPWIKYKENLKNLVLSAWGKLPKHLIPIVFALQELLGQFVWAKAQREACLINDKAILRGHMNNKIENCKAAISAQTQSSLPTTYKQSDKSQNEQQKFLQRIIAVSFVAQAALIAVQGNLDVLSGKSPLDVIPSMLAQGIELIFKAQRAEKSIEKSDRKSACDK